MFSGMSAPSRSCAALSQPLEKCAESMTRLLAADHGRMRHPVQLNDTARARERFESVPRVRVVLEHQQSPPLWRHFGDDGVEIVRRAHEAQPPAWTLPAVVHVEER